MINVNIDTFLKIGHSHKICEDYIISGVDPIPHIILADGCSSSKNTEMGARLLCYLAKQFLTLKDVGRSTYEQMGTWVINNAEMAARQLGLNSTSLDSTLTVSYYDQEREEIIIRTYGDGYVITIDKEENVEICEDIFTKNSPYYLSYKLDANRDWAYHDEKIDLLQQNYGPTTDDSPAAARAYDHEISFLLYAKKYKLVLISSDGIKSFYDKDIPEVSLWAIIDEFTSFKNTTGSFLQRRVSKAIQMYEKRDIFHADDLSIGAYLIQETK